MSSAVENNNNEHQWVGITEEFLYENFINNEPIDQTIDKRIDLDKLDKKKTEFDCAYYKKKFPYFDDDICNILEKCSMEENNKRVPRKKKMKNKPKQIKKQTNQGLKFSVHKKTVEFD